MGANCVGFVEFQVGRIRVPFGWLKDKSKGGVSRVAHPLDSQVAAFVQSLLLVFGAMHGQKTATGDAGRFFFFEVSESALLWRVKLLRMTLLAEEQFAVSAWC